MHSRLSKHNSGPPISAESAHKYRVESPPRNSDSNLRDMLNSNSGHVCHSPQYTSSPVHVSSFRAPGTGDRCSVTRLAGEVDVHVSAISPAQPGHLGTQDHPGGQSDTNSPLVVITKVVPTSTTYVCGPPSLLSVPPGPTVTTCLGRQVIPSARIEALMQHTQAAGFSEEVSRLATAPRTPSTKKIV